MSQTTTIPEADPVIEVTDSLGRKLKLQKLNLLKELDLIEAAGGANAENRRWMILATLAACVIEIDGAPIITPNTREKIRTQVARVKSEGIAAVAAAFKDDIPEDGEDIVAGKVSDETTAKN